ncbi:hypothetical protein [uncultured Rhodoblastus sp.]|uniref:hypothetical protein n=1 Tax=uncultured Rhodoblastus sp. TaxID=543037 RepID=UPI0025D1161D|nr:hypothetical protein [uncultured Rhodoblastus sp.]
MRQFHIYLGFSAKLNRQSMASEHRQIYLLKVGFCEIFEEATALAEWRDRYRNGYPKVDRTQKDSMGRPRIVRGSDGSPLRVSLPLALVDDWDRIAFRLVNDYDRAVKRIEEPIKRWGSRHLDPFCLHRSIYDDVDERHRKHFSNDISVNHNGLGEIFCIRPDQITALRRQLKRYPLKDPLANELLGEAFGYVEKIGDFAFDIEVARCG